MARTFHLKNVIYFPNLNACGGTETYCYEMALKYGKEYDITVFYLTGDPTMIKHIGEVARVIRYKPGDTIICDTFIFGYGWDNEMFKRMQAKEVIQTFHADYVSRHLHPCPNPKVTKRFGVSDNTTKGIKEHYDWAADIQTMYNPYTVKKPRKVLNLISATRLTPEKGFKRMIQFADALDAAGIPFHWDIYTDAEREPFNKSVSILPCRMDILDFIAKADYLVQLSDTEGFSYTVVEALSVGTPVICTEFLVAQENGVIDGKTGFILPFDMNTIPMDKIYKGLPKFKYTPRETHYDEYLSKGSVEVDTDLPKEVTVRIIKTYQDLQLNRIMHPKDKIVVTRDRGEHLEDCGFAVIEE